MNPAVYGVLMILGLVGFIASMCLVVYFFWRRPTKDTPLPDGQYHIHFKGYNQRTGAPIYQVDQLEEDKPETPKS